MTEPRVLILGGDTVRTAAYQAVIDRADIADWSTVIYGPRSARLLQVPPCVLASFDPDDRSLLGLPWTSKTSAVLPDHGPNKSGPISIDDPRVNDVIAETSPDLVVFSGLPGELVPLSLVTKVPFLHAHPGELPAIRGSTAIYWSLLLRRPVACTAILLSSEIDRGPIVLKRNFRVPAIAAALIDNVFDPCIRALTMIHALSALLGGTQPHANDPSLGKDYYVIHPTLKAIAVEQLRRDSRGD